MELTVTNRSRAYPEGSGEEGWRRIRKYSVLKVQRTGSQQEAGKDAECGRKKEVILDSSMVEHTAVNRGVVGSSPTRGVMETEREGKRGSMEDM